MNKVDIQMELEHKYNKNQLVKRIYSEFSECTQYDFRAAFDEIGIDAELGLAVMTQLCIHKQANVPTLVGSLRSKQPDLQIICNTLHTMAEADYINWNPETEKFVVAMDITKDVQAEIDTYQYPLPMIIMPEIVRDNMDTGYLTQRRSIILKDNHHDGDVCLDHINRMNRIPLSIDFEVASMVSNSWKGLDKQKDDETRADYLRRVKSFQKYNETACNVMETLIKCGNVFYLTHRPDKRGRTYSQGHHVNYQGNAWNKAVITFAHGEIVH